MKIIIFIILIIILWKIWNNPNLVWLYVMMFLVFGCILIDIVCVNILLSYEKLNLIIGGSTIIINIINIIFMILPWLLLKKELKLMVNRIYFYINKRKILTYGEQCKAIIKEIKEDNITHAYDKSYYLIVEFNDEKIRSFYFKHNSEKEKICPVKRSVTIIKKDTNEKIAYKVGDEIDVIVYKKWKYVKLYDMQ